MFNKTKNKIAVGQLGDSWTTVILVASLLLLSASVFTDTNVRGTVYNCYTNQPVKNITVRIIEQHPKAFDLWGNYIAKVKSAQLTDSGGNYNLHFKYSKKNKTEYKIELSAASMQMPDKNIKLKNGLQPKHYSGLAEGDNYVNLFYAPTATLALIVHNDSYFDKNDSIGVELSGDIIFPIKIYERKGQVTDEKSSRYIPAGHSLILKWTSRKNGQFHSHADTILLNENEKHIYRINF